MQVIRSHGAGQPSARRTGTFTGDVWMDAVMPQTDGVVVNNVFFTPGARTHWHCHERGQLLSVVSGRGLVCAAGQRPQVIEVGDSVWTPPGEAHWHGGGAESYLLHIAVSIGTTSWLLPVTDEEYPVAGTMRPFEEGK